MECKRTKELLLSDYRDGRLDESSSSELKAHLDKCFDCRSFEAAIREAAVLPFKDLQRHEVPEAVWRNIKERIADRGDRPLSLLEVIKGRLKVLASPKPALVFASTMVIFLVMFGAIAKYRVERGRFQDYFAQQMDFYSMLDHGQENDIDIARTGNSMEEYIF
jgi:anti-sigma factor RsiW